jgi:hypothetical protein
LISVIPNIKLVYWSAFLWVILFIPTFAADRFVDPLGMDIDDCLDSSSPCQSIIYTIDQAAADDTIFLASGTYTEVDITPTKNLILQGNGADSTIVQAGESMGTASGRVFFVGNGVTVTMEAITIRHGKTADGINPQPGSGIFNGGELILRNCKVTKNITGRGPFLLHDSYR